MLDRNKITGVNVDVENRIFVARGPDIIEIPACKPFIIRKNLMENIKRALTNDNTVEFYHYNPTTYEIYVVVPKLRGEGKFKAIEEEKYGN